MDLCSVLVVSCDAYADLWPIFWKLFHKYWPDCPYPLYLGSNFVKYEDQNIKSIPVGEDVSWADNVAVMLDSIPTKYCIMLLDDFLIDRKVDTQSIQKLVQYADEKDLDCLRISPNPPPGKIVEKKLRIGSLDPRAPYFVSTQPAIWRVETLKRLMHKGYSAWDFEIKNSSDRNHFQYRFMGTSKCYIHHHNGVERGNYYKSTLKLLEREQIAVDSEKRMNVINDCTLGHFIDSRLYKLKEKIKIKLVMIQSPDEPL